MFVATSTMFLVTPASGGSGLIARDVAKVGLRYRIAVPRLRHEDSRPAAGKLVRNAVRDYDGGHPRDGADLTTTRVVAIDRVVDLD